MDRVVDAAAALARPGDTVLLAPACASMDLFRRLRRARRRVRRRRPAAPRRTRRRRWRPDPWPTAPATPPAPPPRASGYPAPSPAPPASAAGANGPRTAWAARLQSPLAAYYLVLGLHGRAGRARPRHGAVGVQRGVACARCDSSFTIFTKQAIFAAIGLPLAFVAAWLPTRAWKALSWPLLTLGVVAAPARARRRAHRATATRTGCGSAGSRCSPPRRSSSPSSCGSPPCSSASARSSGSPCTPSSR